MDPAFRLLSAYQSSPYDELEKPTKWVLYSSFTMRGLMKIKLIYFSKINESFLYRSTNASLEDPLSPSVFFLFRGIWEIGTLVIFSAEIQYLAFCSAAFEVLKSALANMGSMTIHVVWKCQKFNKWSKKRSLKIFFYFKKI